MRWALTITCVLVSVAGQGARADGPPPGDSGSANSGEVSKKGSSEDSESKDKKTASGSSADKCATGTAISDKYACDGTEALQTTQTVSNVAGQTIGATATQYAGQQNQMNAMKDGTQSSVYKNAAATAKLGAESSLAVGAMNAVQAALLIQASGAHKDNAEEIKNTVNSKQVKTNWNNKAYEDGKTVSEDGYVNAQSDNAKRVIQEGIGTKGTTSGDLNQKTSLTKFSSQQEWSNYWACKNGGGSIPGSQVNCTALIQKAEERTSAIEKKETNIKSQLNSTSKVAQDEQNAMAKSAMAQGIQAAVQSAQQLANGAFGLMAAKEMEKAAKMTATDPNSPTFTPQLNNLSTTDGNGTGTTAFNPGSDTVTAASGDDKAPTDGTTPDLGTGFNPNDNSNTLAGAPRPGAFAGNSGGGGGGGGGGGLGNVGTSAAKDEPASDQARAADIKGNGPTYYPSGGGFANGGAADKGPDLSGLLAQFLPKKEEETKNGILDFGRSPASDEPYSLLGRDVNLFKRVSETIQANNRKGTVGI